MAISDSGEASFEETFLWRRSASWRTESLPSLESGALRERWAPLLSSEWCRDAVVVYGPVWDSQVFEVASRLQSKGVPLNVVLAGFTSTEILFDTSDIHGGTLKCRSAFVRSGLHDFVPFWRDRVLYVCPDTVRARAGMGRYVSAEWNTAELAWVGSLDCSFMMNDPVRARAADKPRQLKLAQRLGIPIPRTIISRDVAKVRGYFPNQHSVVFKPLAGVVLDADSAGARMMLPCEVELGTVLRDEEWLAAPGIFQERLHPIREWRVVVVGDAALSAAAAREPEDSIDWRAANSIDCFQNRKLPEILAKTLVRLVHELGLEYAAVDLIETVDGFYFLEANPDGTFSWLERTTEIPVVDTICRRLLRGRD